LYGADFAVHPADVIKTNLAFAEMGSCGYRVVQKVDLSNTRRRFVFASPESSQIEYFVLEVSGDSKVFSESSATSPKVRRFLSTTGKGLFLVFLGPDGVGKTTMLHYLSRALAPLFTGQVMYRWRPGFFVPTQHPACLPHSKPPRGFRRSISYLAFSWCDFVAGYCFKTRALLRKQKLVVFDRYYHDLLIDPKRYRYDGPMFLAQLIGRMMPSWDILFMILDADEHAVFARKQQLSVEEIRRQRAAYCEFARSRKNATLIRTDQPLEECRRQALAAVLRHLAERNNRPQAGWLRSKLGGQALTGIRGGASL